MSARAMGDAFEHSPFRDSARLVVHLAIADVVNDVYDNRFWMTRKTLADKARTSTSTVARVLAELVDLGWVEVLTAGGGRARPTEYRYFLSGQKPSHGDTVSGEKPCHAEHETVSPTLPSLCSQPKEPKRAASRKRDAIFDALVEHFGDASTASRAKLYGKISAELRAADATPEQIAAAASEMRRRDWKNPTPAALAKHWPDLLAAAQHEPHFGDYATGNY